jgi:hypothetical protein
MKPAPILPTPELVRMACEEWDDTADAALRELFGHFHRNDNRAHVLLKVVALNRLYSTSIFAVYDVAHHIHQHAQEIDAGLEIGAPEIVDRIHRVTISSTGRRLSFWSFASKYCSWHKQALYPMWDSRVRRYLSSLGVEQFSHPDSWTRYADFKKLISDFQVRYHLESFTFKQIDMFMWKYGAPPKAAQASDLKQNRSTQL